MFALSKKNSQLESGFNGILGRRDLLMVGNICVTLLETGVNSSMHNHS